ncbi:MAG: hypothetical protein ABIR62_06180 [Dokdonella sp.]|uniref:hypothetical protein n=1 Tax=Dokdonella sp. TaxID=2291710 RepID=UPI00326544FD
MGLASLFLMLCLSLGVSIAAASTPTGDVVKADTREAFEAVAANLRKQMAAAGRYAFVKADERAKVEQGLDAMQALFAANESIDRMDKTMRVKLFNAQEVVNSILTLRDRDRLICERGAQTGSRIVSTSCHTYGDIEAARQASSKFMNERTAAPCNTPGCNGR